MLYHSVKLKNLLGVLIFPENFLLLYGYIIYFIEWCIQIILFFYHVSYKKLDRRATIHFSFNARFEGLCQFRNTNFWFFLCNSFYYNSSNLHFFFTRTTHIKKGEDGIFFSKLKKTHKQQRATLLSNFSLNIIIFNK